MGARPVPAVGVRGMSVPVGRGTLPQPASKKHTMRKAEIERYGFMIFLIRSGEMFREMSKIRRWRGAAVLGIIILVVTIPNINANRQIARAAGTVMLAILFGQLMGLVRSILVASAFPAAELDAFSAANRVSETLFTLIAAGALGSAFLPTFTALLVKNDRVSAWKLASSLINLVTLLLSLAAVIAAWFAPQIVRYLLAPGLSHDPHLYALTVSLLRIQSVSAVLFGMGGLVISILNAHQ